jgi:hypothetical protein
MSTASRDSKPQSNVLSIVAIGALLAGCASFWLAKVNSIVPDPYLVSTEFIQAFYAIILTSISIG